MSNGEWTLTNEGQGRTASFQNDPYDSQDQSSSSTLVNSETIESGKDPRGPFSFFDDFFEEAFQEAKDVGIDEFNKMLEEDLIPSMNEMSQSDDYVKSKAKMVREALLHWIKHDALVGRYPEKLGILLISKLLDPQLDLTDPELGVNQTVGNLLSRYSRLLGNAHAFINPDQAVCNAISVDGFLMDVVRRSVNHTLTSDEFHRVLADCSQKFKTRFAANLKQFPSNLILRVLMGK